MERVLNVAKYICDEYMQLAGEKIDELKLHKLLYYTQRESLAILNNPMFDAEFEGWKHGPICKAVRIAFADGCLFLESGDISSDNAYIVRNVVEGYGVIETWQLSKLSHREISWKNARKGLSYDEDGATPLKLSDIQIDAQKVRPYDYLYDMYYDDFDDPEWYDVLKAEPVVWP